MSEGTITPLTLSYGPALPVLDTLRGHPDPGCGVTPPGARLRIVDRAFSVGRRNTPRTEKPFEIRE